MERYLMRPNRRLAAAISILLVVVALISAPPLGQVSESAAASETNKVSLYLSAPFVQGSHVSGPGSSFDNFDSLTPGVPCPTTSPVGAVSATVAGCDILGPGDYSGASSQSSAPTVGGAGTVSLNVPFDQGSAGRYVQFDFGAPVKYVGLWWSAGNDGNIVSFYDSADRLVATLSSNDIVTKLGTLPNPYPGAGTVATHDGESHLKAYYFGNPRAFSSTTPPSASTGNDAPFIYAYLNLFLSGDLGVTKMRVGGPGFEFDNVSVSTVEQVIQDSMVLITEKSVPTLTWAPETSLILQDSPATPSALASSSVLGTISYSVANAGPTGCTVNASTGVITYSAFGNCTVRASFTPTNIGTSFSATKDVTFAIAKPLPNIAWSPEAQLSLDSSPVTPSSLATSNGGAITYSVDNAGATGCTVDTNSAELTFSGVGDCVVRATTAETGTYASTSTVMTFAISNPAPAGYDGPVLYRLDIQCLPAMHATTANMLGQNLSSVSSVEVDGKKVEILGSTAGSLTLRFPKLESGTYDVIYISSAGRLVNQDSLRVCAAQNQIGGEGESASGEAAKGSVFSVSKRFTSYRGDNPRLQERDLRAIKTFLKANPGLDTVTCIGSTSGSIVRTDAKLARTRAENACKIVEANVPGVRTKIAIRPGEGTGQFFRAVTITGSGTR